MNQGYPSKLVDDQFRKASTIPRSDLLRTRARSKRKLFPFVTTFNPNLPDVGRIMRKHRVILESNPKLKELFPPNSIIASFCRSKNLKELLAPSRYGPNTEREESVEVGGCFKCKRTRCDLCRNFLVESNSILSFQTGKSYKIRPKLSCDFKNIIYLASCNRCRLQYIGSTTTYFRVRFRNHKSAMVTKKKDL